MQDRVPTKPGRVLITPEAGAPYYATLTRADEPQQDGDPLNKATLLSDATAAAFGLPNTALPENVLNKLKDSILYQGGAFKNILGSNVVIPATQLSERVRITSGSYRGTHTYGINNPTTIVFPFPAKIVFITIGSYGSRNQGPFWAFFDMESFFNGENYQFLKDGDIVVRSSNATRSKLVFYSGFSPAGQLNDNRSMHYWVAIG